MGDVVVLALFDDAPADRAGPREEVEQRVPVAPADRALELAQILREALEHFQHRLAVVEEDVAPHRRVRRRDPREIAKAARGIFDDLRLSHLLEVTRGADDRVGDQMRQMAGDGEDAVVMLGRHRLDPRAEPAPEFGDALDRDRIRAFGGRDDAPAVAKQRRKARFGAAPFGTGDRMRRDHRRARQRVGQRADDLGLATADVADDRIRWQFGHELARDVAHDADRHAEDHEVRVDHRGPRRVRDVVAELQPVRGFTHARIGVVAGDADRRHRFLHRARHRRADQPQPDDRDARERQHQARSTRSRSAAVTPRVSSSVPIVMRSALGSPWLGSQRTMYPASISP